MQRSDVSAAYLLNTSIYSGKLDFCG